MARWGSWPEYISVEQRKHNARRAIATLSKGGKAPSPVVIEGRAVATTFWGKAWCEHLERFSDYENRLPRGRSYVRSGAVVDLQIGPGHVDAKVRGTRLYKVDIKIERLSEANWRAISRACAGKIDSLVELLQGRFDRAVMTVVGRAEGGLFPQPAHITMTCSCPDWATMCKHVAATLYGVGARLDRQPELLFTLRQVDPLELVSRAPSSLSVARTSGPARLAPGSLESVFGIDLDTGGPPKPAKAAPAPGRAKAASAAPKTSKAAKVTKPAPKAATKVAAKAAPKARTKAATTAAPKAGAKKTATKAAPKAPRKAAPKAAPQPQRAAKAGATPSGTKRTAKPAAASGGRPQKKSSTPRQPFGISESFNPRGKAGH
jgi:uncharacterized Zn finger protein